MDDWRLTDQEHYLRGASLVRKRYRAWSESWDHEHCAFCWATFVDPDLSEANRRAVAGHADILAEGYTTTAEHEHGADYHWICEACFADFAERFRWRLVSTKD